MTRCSVVACNNKFANNADISYFSLPSSKQRKDAWLDAVKKEKGNLPGNILISSDHFMDGNFVV